MIKPSGTLIPILLALACEQHSQPPKQTVHTDSSTSRQTTPGYTPPRDPLEPRYVVAAPDSSFGSWGFGSWGVAGSFYSANHVRHPSGLLIMWLDTAIRASEDRPVGRAHADSVVVRGVRHEEWLGRYCLINGAAAEMVAGLVPDTTARVRPRLAWRFDTDFRIKPVPTDSVKCMLNAPVEEAID